MADTFSCPQCGVLLRRSPALAPGVLVKCPKCAHQFRVPDEEAAPLTPELALPSAEYIPPLRPPLPPENRLAEQPAPPPATFDFDDPPPSRSRRTRDPDEDEDEDRYRDRVEKLSPHYEIQIGAWFDLATNNWTAILGPAIGYIFVIGFFLGVVYWGGLVLSAVMIQFGLPPVAFHAIVFLTSPLLQGTTIVAVRQVMGQRWSFGSFFGGFDYYGQLISLTFFQGVMFLVCLVPTIIALVAMGVGSALLMGGRPGSAIQGPILVLALLSNLIVSLGFLALYTKLCTFAVPLIVHRRFGPIEAMRGSWRLSRGHFWGLYGFNLLTFLIGFGGVLLCIGHWFTMPLASLLQASAYAMATQRSAKRSRARDDEDEEEDRRPSRRGGDDRPRSGPRPVSPEDDY